MASENIKVTLYKKVPRRVFNKIKNNGVTWDAEDRCFRGRIDENKIDSLLKYCRGHHAKLEIENSFGKRSTDYRQVYFDRYGKGFKYSRFMSWVRGCSTYYYCAYCHRKVSYRKVTVDHIYPVAKVSSSLKLQKKLKMMGYKSVNDCRNLTPACFKCNRRKSAKLNWWYVINGRLGQHQDWMRICKGVQNAAFFAGYLLIVYVLILMRIDADNAGGFVLPKEVETLLNGMLTIARWFNDVSNNLCSQLANFLRK